MNYEHVFRTEVDRRRNETWSSNLDQVKMCFVIKRPSKKRTVELVCSEPRNPEEMLHRWVWEERLCSRHIESDSCKVGLFLHEDSHFLSLIMQLTTRVWCYYLMWDEFTTWQKGCLECFCRQIWFFLKSFEVNVNIFTLFIGHWRQDGVRWEPNIWSRIQRRWHGHGRAGHRRSGIAIFPEWCVFYL